MVRLRATKYNPKYRDTCGRYLGDEWTSVSDVGSNYGGRILTEQEYLETEDGYVHAILQLLDAARVNKLTVLGFEERSDLNDCPISSTPQLRESVDSIREGLVVSGLDIEVVSRLALREVIWCRLHGEYGTYIHFGYDYYMYIGTDRSDICLDTPPRGIFYEQFETPYEPA